MPTHNGFGLHRKLIPDGPDHLAPFFEDFPQDTIELLQLLHGTPLSRTYLVSFRNDYKSEHPLVLKCFSVSNWQDAVQEVEHLNLARKIVDEKDFGRVGIPEVVWAFPTRGLFATRYIPGENLDSLYRRSSRLWSLAPAHNYASSVTLLLTWHRAFHDRIRLQREHLPVADNQATDWTKWVQSLTRSHRLPIAWRKDVGTKLERLEKAMTMAQEETGGYHGDFTPWNIRVEPSGQLWVLDWHLLERGHWLEGAYRFLYALRVSALSPLAKRGFYSKLVQEASIFLKTLDDEGYTAQRELFQLRAVLRNLFYLCKRPSLSLKQRRVQQFWVNELSEILDKCTP